jgi:hypothetical protein
VNFETLYVVGEVWNGTAAAVYYVNIEARFYDANDQLVAVEDTYTSLTMTSPGQANPFKLLLFNAPTTIARYELALTYQSDGILDYRAITVLSQQTRDNNGVEVFGEIRNDAESTVRPPQVVVTFYDEIGHVLNTDTTFTSSDLATGQTAVYSIKTFEDIPYTSLSVQAQSYLVP